MPGRGSHECAAVGSPGPGERRRRGYRHGGLRQPADIPMIGISETASHRAMTLGRKCAIVTSSGALCEVYGEQVTRYGVESRHRVGPYSADILRS